MNCLHKYRVCIHGLGEAIDPRKYSSEQDITASDMNRPFGLESVCDSVPSTITLKASCKSNMTGTLVKPNVQLEESVVS